MKKRLLAMAMVACLSFGVIGCGSNSVTPATTESETEATMWPRDGAAGMLPIPNKESGTVDTNATDCFFATVTDYSAELFNEYVNMVKEAGFTEDFTQYEDWYRAFNDAEDDLMLTYDDEEKTMEISFYVHTETTVESETESTAETVETGSDEIRPETKEALDSYEEFMGEYAEFMKKYNENSSDTTLLKDYTSYMTKYADFTDKINKMEDDLNDAELNYYLKVQARVLDKLSEAQ